MTTLRGAPSRAEAHVRLHRSTRGRLVAGVAIGIARHLGLRVSVVRLAFVLLAFAGGAGLAMYAAWWVFVPQARSDEPAAPVRTSERSGRAGQLLAVAALGLGGLLLLQATGLTSPALLPLFAVAGGVAVVWAQSDSAQRERWLEAGRRGASSPGSWSGRVPRAVALAAGVALVLAGLIGFLASRGQLQQARQGLLSTTVVVLGLAVVSGPWWWRLASDLREERRERIRSQERAEIAAHVHDSVLQTLALIRKSDDLREVSRLARTQERELRGWLYAPRPAVEGLLLSAALEQVAAEVELAHGIVVETVVVGDAATTPALLALVAAVREALVNAARHSGADAVSVYAEVGAEGVEAYVRDRGAGFEPAEVADDRYGVRESIVGRMRRHGGRAEVRSELGGGTEVRLSAPDREDPRAPAAGAVEDAAPLGVGA